jgi:hypothetical protein
MKNLKTWFVVLAIVELVVLFAYTLSFNRHYSKDVTQDDMLIYTKDNTYVEGFYGDQSSQDGRMVTSQPLDLPKGVYNIALKFTTNNDYDAIYTVLESLDDTTPDKAAKNAKCDKIYLRKDADSIDYQAYVSRGGSFEVECVVAKENYYVLMDSMHIEYLRGKTMTHQLVIALFWLLLLDLVLVLSVFKKEESAKWFKEHGAVLVSLLGIIAFSSYPLVNQGVYFGDDIFYHLQRFTALGEGLKNGIFPVKISPIWSNYYGYADGVGYGDLLLYPSAILVILGFSPAFAYEFYILMINTITTVVSYFCFKELTKRSYIGVIASALYTLVGFHLHSVYTGALVGEIGAYAFLPLIMLGLWHIYNHDEALKGNRGVLELSFGIFMTIASHVHSTYVLALTLPVLCLILAEKTFKKDVFLKLLASVGITILLGLYFMVPVADYLLTVPMEMGSGQYILWRNATAPENLFFSTLDPNRVTGGWAALGVTSLVVYFLFLLLATKGLFGKKTGAYLRIFAYTIFLIFMTTTMFPYFGLKQVLPGAIYDALEVLQFPWHFLNVIVVLTTFFAAKCIKALEELVADKKEELGKAAAMLAGAMLCMITLFQAVIFYGSVFDYGHVITAYDSEKQYFGMLDEFAIKGSDYGLSVREKGLSLPSEAVSGSITRRKATTIFADITNSTEETQNVKFPLWAYKGYKAKGNGKALTLTEADDHRVSVEIPESFSGTVKVYFSEPWYWRLSELISLATVIAAAVYIRKAKRS